MRQSLVARFLGLPRSEARVVDIGSGQGDLVATLVRQHPRVQALGLELSAEGVAISGPKAPGARFIQRNLLEEGDADPGFAQFANYAICSEVLEHVDDPVRLLRNARAFLAPRCRLVVTVPGGPMSAFDHHIGHRRHHTASSLRAMLTEAGFDVEQVICAGFPFFNLYRLTVIMRGRRLIDDVAAQEGSRTTSGLTALAMGIFRQLFRLNITRTPWGWQLVAVAHLRSPDPRPR